MVEVNNKFEIGEEVYTVIRVPVTYKCPICEGEGKFMHNGYEVNCKNCCGSGELHNAHQSLLFPVKARVQKIIASIWNDVITVKYKVDCTEVRIRNRSETTLFKTLEEAEQYCKECNTKEKAAEF